MANEILHATSGLKARLSVISGLRVLAYTPASWSEFPLAIVALAGRSASNVALGGRSFEGEFVITVLVDDADSAGVGAFIDPTGASSIESAIEGDPTLGGSVDYAKLTSVTNIGRREIGSGSYPAADFTVEFVKQVSGQ